MNTNPTATTTATAKDPVCGMTVDAAAPKGGSFAYEGVTYRFCNPKCRERFMAEPTKYLHREAAPVVPTVAAAVPGVTYVCPMDPEVRSSKPGPCPKCGMALEPETVSLDDGDSAELVDMRRRLWVCAALTVPTAVLAMGEHLPGNPVGHVVSA